MGTIYFNKVEKYYSVFLKGAPEVIENLCNRIVNKNGMISIFSKDNHFSLMEKQAEFANRSERTLAFAYGEINQSTYNEIISDTDNVNEIFSKVIKEKNFIFVAMMGIADPPRADVKQSIEKCKSAGVFVRMVTGDNINTALAVSQEVGILEEYEYNLTKQRISSEVEDVIDINFNLNVKIYALEGKSFRVLCGGYKIADDPNSPKNKIYKLKDFDKFKKVTEHLKIIARASPEDKFLLVLGLKELKNIVAVTGDGTNDAPALKKSDVGFAMGKKGTDIAKEASDIVLLNDSFSSVVTAIKYGRNVYDCIRKFIQFQLTTNIVAVFMTLLGGLVLEDAPLNAIQMLWVNLIMDSLASLALATEDASEKLLVRKPYPRDESMVTQSMMRNVIVQASYQILILSIFLFFGDTLFNVPSDRNLSHFEWNAKSGYHFTLFFNIFVFLQVFNSINSRKLEQSELNVFENILGNNIYLGVQAFIVFGQILIVQLGGRAIRTKPLTFAQHFACMIIASTCLIAGYFGKKINYNSKLPTEEEVLKKMDEVSSTFRNSLPARGHSFRSNSITNMAISHKR
jgi:Ca2+ transporting ATPase